MVMVEIIFKGPVEKRKIDALKKFLDSLDLKAHITEEMKKPSKKTSFSLHTGIWEDYNIDGSTLRKKAWKIK